MTTITFRDGILAADTLMTSNGTVMGESQKIFVNDKFAVAHSGDAETSRYFLDYLTTGKEHKFEENNFVFYDFEKKQICCNDKGKRNFLINDKFTADGSGYEMALGIMEMGATAIEAVEVTMRRDVSTGGRVIAYDCINRKWIHKF